jgi:hypothetical protein
MATKTKAELMTEINQKNEEIKKLEEEIKVLEKYKQYKDMGDELKAMHTAYEVAGFTSDQAFTLLIETISLFVMLIVVNLLQYSNAHSPIVATVFPITTVSKFQHA